MAITVLQEKESHNISVYVRVRPLSSTVDSADWDFKPSSISHVRNGCKKDYVLDSVFRENSCTDEVYQQTTQPLVKTVLDGFSCTVFAYGQTNSGKTYTMRGTSSQDGIVGRAVHDLFDKLAQHPDRQFCLRASYMEIYNEEVNDLLNTENRNLSIKMDQDSGVIVAGLSEVLVYSKEDVMRLLVAGDSKRHIGETRMNDKSSRSHSIFKMVVESTPMEGEDNRENCNSVDAASFAVKIGVLNLVDLAGSERVTKTGAEGSRLKEGANINKSLLTLGLVIKNLSEGASLSGRHTPYRDSKLTRILQPSLGGNAKTVIICMMTPEAAHVDEGHNTLEFATRAKKVVNEVAAVETMTSAALLKRQANEIEKLKAQLCSDGSANVAQQIQELQQKLLDMEKAMEIQAASMEVVTKEKVFFEKRNMDLMAASKRAAQKRTRMRRETIAHFGPVPDDVDAAASPCSGATRDSEMSGEAGHSAEGGAGAGLPLLPVIGEEEAASGMTDMHGGENEDGGPHKKLSRASLVPESSGAAGAALDGHRFSGGGGARAIPAAAVEPFADELRARVRDLKAQLVERDAEVLACQAEVASVLVEKESVQSELTKAQVSLQREQYERRSLAASGKQKTEEVAALKKQLEEAIAVSAVLQEDLGNARSSLIAVHQERDADARDAATRLREAHEAQAAAESAGEKAQVEINLLQERDRRRLEELNALATEAQALRKEREAAVRGAANAGEGSARIAEELRDSQEEIERLKSHVRDLESRKRPPLYQRKQEEELKAATEHATECETRTATAEAVLKVAQEERMSAVAELAALRDEADRAAMRHAEQMEEWRVKWEFDLNEAKTKAAKVEADLQEQVEDLQEKADWFEQEARKLEDKIEQGEAAAAAGVAAVNEQLAARDAELQAERCAVREWEEALTQQNAVVAKLEDQVTAQEGALQSAKQAAETIQAAAAEEKDKTTAAHEAAMAEAATQHRVAAAQLTAALAAAAEQHTAELAAAQQAAAEAQEAVASEHAAELTAKVAEVAALGMHAQKLQEKLDESPAAFKALAELKELRVKYKQETSSLNSQLKAASMSSKGGDKAKQLLQREFEKLQKKQADTDAKLRTITSDKQQLTSDKSSLERKVKQLEMQVSKSSKDVEKKETAASKKLEASQEALNKAKEDFGKLEAKFKKARDDGVRMTASQAVLESRIATVEEQLEETARVRSNLEDQLAEMQESYMELENEMDELQTSHKAAVKKGEELNAQVSALSDQLTASQSEGAASAAAAESEGARRQELEDALHQAQHEMAAEAALRQTAESAHAAAAQSLEELRQTAAALQQRLDTEQQQRKATADELTSQLQTRTQEVARLKEKVTEAEENIATTDDMARALLAEREAAQGEAQGAHARAEDAEAELEVVRQRLTEANDALAQHDAELHARNADVDARDREIRNLRRERDGLETQLAALQGTRGEQEREAESGRAAAVAELRAVREELHTAQKRIADETAAGTESAAALRDALSAVSRADAARDTLAAQVATLQDQVKGLSEEAQTLARQLAMAKAAEEGLRSREDIARRGEAEARLSADRHCDNAAVLQDDLSRARAELANAKMELQVAQLKARSNLPPGPLEDTAAAGTAQDEVQQLREEAVRLRMQLEDVTERHGAAAAELQQAQRGAEEAQAAAAAMRIAALAAEERAAQLEAELRGAAAAAAGEAHAAAGSEIASLQEEVMRLEAETEAQKAELSSITQALEEAQSKAEKAAADHMGLKELYIMQKHLTKRLECVQERLHVELQQRHGIPREDFAALLAWLTSEYNRLYALRQKRKQQKADSERASGSKGAGTSAAGAGVAVASQ